MAEIISLSKVRKQKAREDKEKRAAVNRTKFGRKKADKILSATKNKKADKKLSDHKIED